MGGDARRVRNRKGIQPTPLDAIRPVFRKCRGRKNVVLVGGGGGGALKISSGYGWRIEVRRLNLAVLFESRRGYRSPPTSYFLALRYYPQAKNIVKIRIEPCFLPICSFHIFLEFVTVP